MRLLDEVEPEARSSVRSTTSYRTPEGRLVGFNTDAPGFRAGVELAMGRSLAGANVVVAGAGGVARAVVFACLEAGANSVTVGNRSVPAEVSGVAAVAYDGPEFAAALRTADLAVNATTVGMVDPGMTLDIAALPAHATVFDWCTCRHETPLLTAARARGLRAANGSEMLIAQAAIAFERWTGVGGMAGVMRAAVAPLSPIPNATA